MAKFTNPLDGVRVAAPCPADWERMVGDERMRYCGQCNLHVYNLSGMARAEAEALITNAEGRLCVRFYRRAEGHVLTSNCPVGLRAAKQTVSEVSATNPCSTAASVTCTSTTSPAWRGRKPRRSSRTRKVACAYASTGAQTGLC